MTAVPPIPHAAWGEADTMEDYARHLKNQLPPEQQMIIDAIILSETVRMNVAPTADTINRLRMNAAKYRRDSPFISNFMDLIATKLETPPAPLN